MDIAALVQGQSARPVRRPRRRPGLAVLAVTALSGLALAGLLRQREAPAPTETATLQAAAETPEASEALPAADLAWMLDPNPTLDAPGFAPRTTLSASLDTAFRPPEPVAPAPQVAELAPDIAAPAEAPAPVARPAARLALTVPLPVRRPAEFRYEPREQVARLATPNPRAGTRQARESTRQVFSAAVTDDRSFFEKLFGGASTPSQPASANTAMAYAGQDGGAAESAARRRLVPGPVAEPGVAVYDISAATVTLPSGEVLEAHSGLGVAQDNPDYVHLRMRGATPPGVYDLREREAPFHGVRAIRLNPVGGSAAIHGRDGILAHTYMLGPSGASNGCVVFKQYDRFLRAYLRGEVRRIVVVPGTAPGIFASRRGARRSASAD
ncbi:DUF2778 domain-containing protein [Methylorubrum sp. SB2]|uniref:DUF2778 domain-containing protein n=1 Tax=Methylorubrum subtropicum TaxID=3138812 RepID=UPI00313DBC9D